jgi:hypothetical protein
LYFHSFLFFSSSWKGVLVFSVEVDYPRFKNIFQRFGFHCRSDAAHDFLHRLSSGVIKAWNGYISKPEELGILKEVLQLCSHPVVGWPDATPGIFGLRSFQVAAIRAGGDPPGRRLVSALLAFVPRHRGIAR